MKKILAAILWLIISMPLFAQYAYRIRPLPALPATCNPLNGDVVMLTLGAGASPGVYNCTQLNTWRPIGVQNNQFNMHQGTLTASMPFFNHTATWNQGATVFHNFISNITDTASSANSMHFELQVGGANVFSVRKDGMLINEIAVITGTGGYFQMNARSRMQSTADYYMNFTSADGTGFLMLGLGPAAVTHPSISVSAAVAGQTQGIIITRGDATNQTFAGLGAATNGSMIYCADCTIASPCAGAGTGAIAKRLNGVWVCN